VGRQTQHYVKLQYSHIHQSSVLQTIKQAATPLLTNQASASQADSSKFASKRTCEPRACLLACLLVIKSAYNMSVCHDTPMAAVELKPYTGYATPSEVNKYQRKIGSFLFAAVTIRPDIAFATSRLACFLTNLSTKHHNAADRVLLYLLKTKWMVLQLGGVSLQVASDASFADNTLDHKSSQGYTIKLFNGLIAWRSSKQDTATISTTEAELLALSQVAKEAMFISRLLQELGIKLSEPAITIQCNNNQTIL
jgi:hypothetical protein